MVKFKGNTVTLVGQRLTVGEDAPNFTLTATDLSKKTLQDFAGKVKLISVVPSIDTGVCDMQTRQFNEQLAHEAVAVITVSVDLPFAQARWCGASGLEHVITLSDYMDKTFGKAYGVLIDELQLLSRAVFVLDKDNKITYVEYLEEVSQHPDYEAAKAAVKTLIK